MSEYLYTGEMEGARTLLSGLVAPSTSPELSDEDLNRAILAGKVRDSENRWITHENYVPTYNLYWAAGQCALTRSIRELSSSHLKRFSSEGSTFERESVNWTKVAAEFQRLAAAEQGDIIDHTQVWTIDRQLRRHRL